MKYLILLILFMCTYIFSQDAIEAGKESLKQVDRDFSKLSEQKGMVESFMQYAADDAVLLRDYTMPIVGRDAVYKFINEGSNDFTLIWEPLFADISNSLDLGYTYGTFILTFKDETGTEQKRDSTYLTIWKKDRNGNWKWVLDNGNQGLEPKK